MDALTMREVLFECTCGVMVDGSRKPFARVIICIYLRLHTRPSNLGAAVSIWCTSTYHNARRRRVAAG